MRDSMYDYLIVGSGLFGAVFAHEARQAGKSVLVLERREHVGGNVYCEMKDGINIHKYGAHIFHTSYEDVWDYVNRFVKFNNFINSPVANYQGHLYNLPFNMNTFRELWDIVTPAQARDIIAEQRRSVTGTPKNLEEQAISLVGTDIYTKLIKGYTEKQWGRSCTELPAFIIKRLPVRYTFDNNYFNDCYQGIPMGGYNKLIDALLEGIEVRTGVDYLRERATYRNIAKTIVYTGSIDEYSTTSLDSLSIEDCILRLNDWRKKIIRGWLSSIIRNVMSRILALLSINISNLAHSQLRILRVNILQNGNVEKKRTIRSIMNETKICISSMLFLADRSKMSYLVAVWLNIGIMIWMMSLKVLLNVYMKSCAKEKMSFIVNSLSRSCGYRGDTIC